MKTKDMSWALMEAFCRHLVSSINECSINFKYITGIPRGGLIPAVFLSHHLNLKFVEYHEILSTNFVVKDLLIVDEVYDTGTTLKNKMKELELIKRIDFETIGIAVISKKIVYEGKFKFFFAEKVPKDIHIIYPWEEEKGSAFEDLKD